MARASTLSPRTGAAAAAPGFARFVYPVLIGLIFVASCVNNFAGAALAAAGLGLAMVITRGTYRTSALTNGLIVVAAVVLAFAFLPSDSAIDMRVQEVVRFASVAAAGVFLTTIAAEDVRRGLLIIAAIIAATIPPYLALGSFFIIDGSGIKRFASITPHANHLAYVCAIVVGSLLLTTARPLRNPIYLAAMAAALVATALTQSSGGTLVLLALIAVYVSRFSGRRAKIFLGVIVVAAATLVLPQFEFFQAILGKFEVVNYDAIYRGAMIGNFGNLGSSFGWRLAYWVAILTSLFDAGLYHALLGMGPGSGTQGHYAFAFMQFDPHSDIVRLTLEYGVIGMAIMVLALIGIVRGCSERVPAAIMLFGPMLAGNSIVSFPVFFTMIMGVRLLGIRPPTGRGRRGATSGYAPSRLASPEPRPAPAATPGA